MKQTIYISIFGLNLSLINELKKIISSTLSDDYSIMWTNIADEKLQLLLVNDNFSDSPNIQKLKYKNIKIIKLQKNENSSAHIDEDTIYYPIQDEQKISIRIKQFFQDISKNEQTNHSQEIKLSNKINQKISFEQFSSIFNIIHNEIKSGKYIVKTHTQNIALIDVDHYQFYIEPNLSLHENSSPKLIKASLDDILNFKKTTYPIDLKQGLWQFTWDYLEQEIPEYQDYYRLTRWPKFLNPIDRQNILRLSTAFSLGTHTQYAEKNLKIGRKYIHFFLCVCDLNRDLKLISPEDAKFKWADAALSEKNSVRGFFKSLRKKLGL